MSINVSVKDALRHIGDRYDFELNATLEPVDYMGHVTFDNVMLTGFYFFDGKAVRFSGNVKVDCGFECDRCLKEFTKSYDLTFNEMYSPDAEDEMFRLGKTDVIDIQPLLNDTVLASLPIQRLCKDDCKGLCPHCGIDKNFSSCSCEDNGDGNPFSVLKGLVD